MEFKKKPALFDYLNSITTGKEDRTEEELDGYVPFLINRYVSMCDIYLPIVAQLNQYNLGKEEHYRCIKNILPKRRQFFPYIRKPKHKNPEGINAIKEYFEIGNKDAEIYYDILGEKNVKKIISKMGGRNK